jgi:hypothetical protein
MVSNAGMASRRPLTLIALALAVVIVPRSTAAQSLAGASVPTLETVQAMLRSATASEVAWGAFFAAQFQMKDAIPAIVERLQALPDADPNARRHVIAGLLDALMQLRARVPAAVLLPYYDEWPIHTLALLGSAGEGRDAALVGVLRTAHGYQWYGAANLLLANKPPGFAAELLRGLTLTLTVTVSDSVKDGGVLSGVVGGVGGGDGQGQLPAGFPPYAHYSFGRASGAILLAFGPRPVFYTRAVYSAFQFWLSGSGIGGPYDRDRLEYLEEIQGLDRVTLYPAAGAGIRWTDETTFRSDVENAKAPLRERYGRLIAALLKRGLLTEGEAQALPARIVVNVSDQRAKPSPPLPSVD